MCDAVTQDNTAVQEYPVYLPPHLRNPEAKSLLGHIQTVTHLKPALTNDVIQLVQHSISGSSSIMICSCV